MKVTCEVADLLEAVKTVLPAIPTRSPKEVLQSIKISAGDGALHLVGGNLETRVETTCKAGVESGGACLIPAKQLHQILANLPEGQVMIAADGSAVTINAQRRTARIPTQKVEDYPEPTAMVLEKLATVHGLKTAISRAMSCVAHDSTRYALGCLYIDTTQDFTVVGTDGNRIGVQGLQQPSESQQSILVPKPLAAIASRLLDDSNVQVAFDENWVQFTQGGTVLLGRIGAGRYPNWRDVLGRFKPDVETQVDAGQLLSAARHVDSLIDETDLNNAANVEIRDDKIILSPTNSAGQATAEVPIESTGKTVQLHLQARYLLSGLAGMDGLVTLGLNEKQLMLTTNDGFFLVIQALGD